MAPTKKTSIDANGVVQTEDENGTLIDTSNPSSRFPVRMPSRIDIFGFSLTPKQFLLVALLALLMLGREGFGVFLAVFALYHLFLFISGSRASNNRFGGKGRSFGANIHGVKVSYH